MDTRINSLSLEALPLSQTFFISPQELFSLLDSGDAPLLLDVRPPARFDASTHMLATARRCSPENLAALTAELIPGKPCRPIVTYCVYGHHVSANAAADLRAAGFDARALAGGFEGGEEGVDSAALMATWRVIVLQKVAK